MFIKIIRNSRNTNVCSQCIYSCKQDNYCFKIANFSFTHSYGPYNRKFKTFKP